MWVSKRFDLTWRDLAAAFGRCLRPGNAKPAAAEVEALWSARGDALACLSVRSAFDLYLRARRLPPGSEVVFSAMTVADMPRIAMRHGLVPVPCDLDPETGAPTVATLERACTEQTRAVVLAHLFGARMELDELIGFAHERGLQVIEDCAEAYAGRSYTGHPGSDVALFSFGPIKNATALGGALARVRDERTLTRMRKLHRRWPKQPVPIYALRVLKYALFHALSMRVPYTLISAFFSVLHVDLDRLTNRLTRGFGSRKFFHRIRRRPCEPLLRTMQRRLRQDVDRLERQQGRGRALVAEAGLGSVCPGWRSAAHTFWLLPVLADDPDALARALRRRGFASTRGRAFTVVGSDEDPPRRAPGAERIQRLAVYVPFYPAMSDAAVGRLAGVLASALTNRSATQAETPPTHPPTNTSTP